MKLVWIFKVGRPNQSLTTKVLFLMRILRSDYLILSLILPKHNTKVVSDSEIPGQQRQLSSAAVSHLWLQTPDCHWSNRNNSQFSIYFCFSVITWEVLSSLQSWGTQAPVGDNLEDDPCPPAELGYPVAEGVDHCDHFLGVWRNRDSLLRRTSWGCRTTDPPGTCRTLRLSSSACLAWVALMAKYAFLFFSKFSGTSGIRRLGLRAGQSGHIPITSRIPNPPRAAPSPVAARCPRMTVDLTFFPSLPLSIPPSLHVVLTLPAPPSCRAPAAHARGWAGPWRLPLRGCSSFPGWRSRWKCLVRRARDALLAGGAANLYHALNEPTFILTPKTWKFVFRDSISSARKSTALGEQTQLPISWI